MPLRKSRFARQSRICVCCWLGSRAERRPTAYTSFQCVHVQRKRLGAPRTSMRQSGCRWRGRFMRNLCVRVRGRGCLPAIQPIQPLISLLLVGFSA